MKVLLVTIFFSIFGTSCNPRIKFLVSGLENDCCITSPILRFSLRNPSSQKFDTSISLEKMDKGGKWQEFCPDLFFNPIKIVRFKPYFAPKNSQQFQFDISKTANLEPLAIGNYRIVVSAIHSNTQNQRVFRTESQSFKVIECDGGGSLMDVTESTRHPDPLPIEAIDTSSRRSNMWDEIRIAQMQILNGWKRILNLQFGREFAGDYFFNLMVLFIISIIIVRFNRELYWIPGLLCCMNGAFLIFLRAYIRIPRNTPEGLLSGFELLVMGIAMTLAGLALVAISFKKNRGQV